MAKLNNFLFRMVPLQKDPVKQLYMHAEHYAYITKIYMYLICFLKISTSLQALRTGSLIKSQHFRINTPL